MPSASGDQGQQEHDGHSGDRRVRPSDALLVEFLLGELRDAHERISDLEAVAMRSTWRVCA